LYRVYIDDSGSSPEHKVVVASGILVPSMKIVPMKSEWNRFLEKESIPDFHASECLARNPRSAFAGWEEDRVRRVFARVRQLTLKYSVRGFAVGIYKKEYDEVMPEDLRCRVGSYYTWALSSIIGLAHDYGQARSARIEYVFDTAEKNVKRDITEAMEYSETLTPGDFTGHYSFAQRRDAPALQAADLYARADTLGLDSPFPRLQTSAGITTTMLCKETGPCISRSIGPVSKTGFAIRT
jgi:hypothetical protein